MSDNSTFKPDFQILDRFINIKCIVIAAEFKRTSRNSAIESDLVKLDELGKHNETYVQ